MADTFTPNLGMLLADPNDPVNVVTHIENNLTLLDTYLSAVKCTSATRPSTTYPGQLIYETDTKRFAVNSNTKASPTWTYIPAPVQSCTSSTRPTVNLLAGLTIYETDTNRFAIYTGSAWQQVTYGAFVCTSSTRPAAPFTGLEIFETDTKLSYTYDGSTFQPNVPASYPRGSMGAAISTTSTGTATSGTTETLDTVLGTYQFTAVSGRRYRVKLDGLVGNGGAVSDVYEVRIRDSGSASTPTASSTCVAANSWTCTATGSPGRAPIPVAEEFVAGSSGTHTIGVFAVRTTGTGAFTPIPGSTLIGRSLSVEDIGT